MICWITDKIGTGAFEKVAEQKGSFDILDVRQLVDKPGNSAVEVKKLIHSALEILNQGKKIVICCDHGISRSNAIASGVIAKSKNISFYDAVRIVLDKTNHAEIKPGLLDVVQESLGSKMKNISKSKSILITGSTGDIGRELTPRLKNSFDTFPVSSKEINLLKDLSLLHVLVKEKKIKTIVHLANPRVINTNASLGEALTMLKNVIDVCLLHKCKLIFISSLEVYAGSFQNKIKVTSKTKLQPKGVQGETNYLCEELIRQSSRFDQLNYCIVRMPAVYGKNCLKPKFLLNFISKAKTGRKIETHKYSNGFPFVDMLHIDDAVECIYKILKKGVVGEFSISGKDPLSTHSIAEIVVRKLKSSSEISSISIRDKYCNIVADNQIAFKNFGWKPIRKFNEALDELI